MMSLFWFWFKSNVIVVITAWSISYIMYSFDINTVLEIWFAWNLIGFRSLLKNTLFIYMHHNYFYFLWRLVVLSGRIRPALEGGGYCRYSSRLKGLALMSCVILRIFKVKSGPYAHDVINIHRIVLPEKAGSLSRRNRCCAACSTHPLSSNAIRKYPLISL